MSLAMTAKASLFTIVQPGLYQHFKGGIYQVLLTAAHSETEEAFVVYLAQDTGKIWIRPLSMFVEEVWHEGKYQPRFEKLRELAAA